MQKKDSSLKPIVFKKDHLLVLDQRSLPTKEVFRKVDDISSAFRVIKEMVVRGAPLIGVTAAYSVYLEAQNYLNDVNDLRTVKDYLNNKIANLEKSRPTAVNLKWALNRMRQVINGSNSKDGLLKALLSEAQRIETEEKERCVQIANYGLDLFKKPSRVLTICNTGKLATPGIGTALGIIYLANEHGLIEEVYVPETRPWLQGARLTAFELAKANIPHSVIVDSAAPFLLSRGYVDMVIVGADRIARNGDTANKIGTLSLALACKEFAVPFYVAAPISSFDLSINTGDEIEIESRHPEEIRRHSQIPLSSNILNYAFDITPGGLITAFITDKGIISPPFDESIL